MTGKGSLNHNSRKFHAKNTDPNRTHWNVEYCNEDIKDVYHELFDEALKRYNDKQTRKDRKIDDYYEKIRSGKQEKLFHEVILQIGDKDNMGSETMEGQLAAKILDEYMKGFQERNPTLRVFAAHLHLDEATPHLHIDFIPYVTGSKRGLDTRVSLKRALSSLGFKGGSRSETELNQWVQSEKEKLAMVMRENEIEWDQKGTHEPHLSVLDYKKKVREQEVEELTEHKNLLEHDLHDISECVDEIQKEKEQVEKERDAVIKKTEVLEKRFSALNSKAGLVDSHAREYGYYPEEWLPEAGTLESAKSYRKRIFPLLKKVANMIQGLYSKYLELKSKNQKLSDRNIDLENRVDRLREEVSVIKEENAALLNVTYDMDRVVAVLGENKVKEAIEVAKHLEQANAKQKTKKSPKDLHDLLFEWIGGDERLAILDLSNVPFEVMDITVGLITRFVYDSMFWGRNEPNTGRNRPLLIAYEEAHSYLGKNDTIYAKEAVERIFKEGRKFGLGAVVISQRPSELSETILAQVGTFIALRLTLSLIHI